MKEYNENMDQLFKEKLSDRKVFPSTDAWNKLQEELRQSDRKKTAYFWYVAASVILLISIGITYTWVGKTSPENTLVMENSPVEKIEDIQSLEKSQMPVEDEVMLSDSENIREMNRSGEKEENDAKLRGNENKPIDNSPLASEKYDVQIEQSELTQKTDDNREPNAEKNKSVENLALAVPEVQSEEPVNVESDVTKKSTDNQLPETLDLSEQSNSEEYFSEVTIIYKKSDTQPEKKKTFKKIINLAKDIKEGEYGIGDLREVKNELLAFGKRKEKND